MTCPYCGKRNQPTSTFCIHCGEPIDEASVPELAGGAARPEAEGDRKAAAAVTTQSARRQPKRELWASERGVEFVLGFVLVVAVIGYAIFNSIEQERLAGHYRAGMEASLDGDYDRAIAEFINTPGFRDTDKRIQELRAKVQKRNTLYSEAKKAREAGKLWQMAAALKQVAEIQPGYADTQAWLAEARRVNGIVAYRIGPRADGTEGIYVAQADGGEAQRLPDSTGTVFVHALSPDGKWLLYSRYDNAGARKLLLYDIIERKTIEVTLPVRLFGRMITARFAPGSQSVLIDVSGAAFSLQMPQSPVIGPLSAEAIQPDITGRPVTREPDVGLVVYDNPAGPGQVVAVSDQKGSIRRTVAVERGALDGAVFSADGRYLLYRTCRSPGDPLALNCALRLVDLADLSAKELQPVTVGSAPVRSRDSGRSTLDAEFTRDGKHLLLIERYNDQVSVELYDLESKTTIWVQDGSQGDVARDLLDAPLVATGVPGLQFWEGPNSLTYTQRTVRLPEAGGDRVPRYFARSHWFSVAPNKRYAVYLMGKDTNPRYGDYKLYAVPLESQSSSQGTQSKNQLAHTTRRPGDWLQSTYLLPDSQTLLSTEPPKPRPPGSRARGLYAYDLETGQAALAILDVEELWPPGYASVQPEMP